MESRTHLVADDDYQLPVINLEAGRHMKEDEHQRNLEREAKEGGKEGEEVEEQEEEPSTWRNLPYKEQLTILALARFSEPLIQTSVRAYLFYQLKSFDRTLSDSAIASQAGLVQASFNAAQLCTALFWGRFSDRNGRKPVLLFGLLGTAISCIGFGFSASFMQAIIWRVIGGALNGNIGVMRTMLGEMIPEKKHQRRAFLILPIISNLGVIIGPLLGGLLADPASNYPQLFGTNSFLIQFPYSPPNLCNGLFVALTAGAVFLCSKETHEIHRYKKDIGRRSRRKLATILGWPSSSRIQPQYFQLNQTDGESYSPGPNHLHHRPEVIPGSKPQLSLCQVFTYDVIITLVASSLLNFGNGTFNNIFFTFQSTSVVDNQAHSSDHASSRFLKFTGGLGLPPRDIGITMALLGFVGITLQIFFYPMLDAWIGTLLTWKICLYCFPIVYVATPFLALLPSTLPPPSPKSGILVWICMCGVLFVQSLARTFATPAALILIHNCSPHPSALGTVHGIVQTANSAAKALGPALGGWLYGVGLSHGVVGAAFWGLAGMAILNVVAASWVRERKTQKIQVDNDRDSEK